MMVDDLPNTTRPARLPSLHGGSKSRKNDRNDEQIRPEIPSLQSLVVPWASMVILSFIAVTVVYCNSSFHHNDDNNADFDFEFPDSSISSSSYKNGILERFLSGSGFDEEHRQHVHKPVYNEDHPPLFPLSDSDKIGFILAILGLMVAAGGGVGGGGIIVPIYVLVSPIHPTEMHNTLSHTKLKLASLLVFFCMIHSIYDYLTIRSWDLVLSMVSRMIN
jgi:hypothetical protein